MAPSQSLAAGQRLHYMDRYVRFDAPAQRRPETLSVEEYGNVPADTSLIVQHVAPHLRMSSPDIVQSRTDGSSGYFNAAIRRYMPQVRGEKDLDHGTLVIALPSSS
jgi:hypothetical protein